MGVNPISVDARGSSSQRFHQNSLRLTHTPENEAAELTEYADGTPNIV